VTRLDGGREGALVVAEIAAGVRLELDLHSHVERQIFYRGFYRPFVRPHFDALLGPGQTVVDIGANVGQYCLCAAARVGPRGRVFAFEPSGRVFEKLKRNIALSGLTNVFADETAISDFEGEAVLHQNREGDRNEGQASMASLDLHAGAQPIRCLPLPRALAAHGVERVDVLKIDTQGAEMAVLRGAQALFARKPAVLLRCHEEKCNALGDSTVEVQEFLLERGYALYELDPRRGRISIASPRVFDDLTLLAIPR
jgi:FkbM family methyltransferase